MIYIGGTNDILYLLLKVKYLLILREEMAIETNEVIDEVLFNLLHIQLMLKICVDLFHYLVAKLIVKTKSLAVYCLEMACAVLLARIIDRIKLSFSQRILSSSFKIRKRSEEIWLLITSCTRSNLFTI